MRLFALLWLWLLAGYALAAEVTAQILVQSSPLAGFQYYAGKAMWDEMHEGDALTLVREPDNVYDARAVRVEWQGRKLGYVPRRDNAAVARMLDNGTAMNARITRLTKSRNPWQRILFEVYVPLQ
ncbi:HIRAN domain-containing protein [Sulfuriferula thiophila]|uniref:HIRAN domain-containing protein n=1 Tax=Sulfuriferula thiophila TaxID=1781211 RepID=UPI000F605791|nr:HIRAN domain-containing protein [Sulfuriferula thiophila]